MTSFEIPEEARTQYIDDRIMASLPRSERETARKRVVSIVERYIGRDADALSILKYASERGRFDEFAGKLETECKDLGFVDPGLRRMAHVSAVIEANAFFRRCYGALGIKERQPVANP